VCDGGKAGEAAALPKPEGSCCVPEFLNLGRIILDKLLVIDYEEGVSRDVFWERGQGHGGWGVRFFFGNTGSSPCFVLARWPLLLRVMHTVSS